MKKIILFLSIIAGFWGCASSVNTSNLTPEEYLNYAIGLYNDEDYLECIKEFQSILLQFPGNAISDDAQYYLALSHFGKEEYILAAYEFSRLIKDMPASDYVPKAQYMLSESYFQLSPRYQLDQKYTRKAIEEFQAFIDFFPTDPRVPEAESKIAELNNKLAEKEFNNAVIYEKLGYNNAAIYYYNTIMETYHDSKFCPQAMYSKIKLLLQKNDKVKAGKDIATFLQKYPTDSNAEDVKKLQESLN